MKKALSLILALVLCLSLCACGGKKSPIVGTWHTYAVGATSTYTFTKDGKYTLEIEGSVEAESDGEYTFNQEDGTIILCDEDGNETTQEIELRDCCMILNDVKYGKVYDDKDSCEVLNDVLGKWVHTSLEGTYLKFKKDGTCSLTTPDGKDKGIYIYDPVLKQIEIPAANLIFEFEETTDGIELNATNARGLYFKR